MAFLIYGGTYIYFSVVGKFISWSYNVAFSFFEEYDGEFQETVSSTLSLKT